MKNLVAVIWLSQSCFWEILHEGVAALARQYRLLTNLNDLFYQKLQSHYK